MACNGTWLRLEVRTMSTRLWKNLDISLEMVRGALGFVWNMEKMLYKLDSNFEQTVDARMKNYHESNTYQTFGEHCKTIFRETCDKKSQLEICIFCEQVTNEFAPYYHRLHSPKLNVESPPIDVEAYLTKIRNRRYQQKPRPRFSLPITILALCKSFLFMVDQRQLTLVCKKHHEQCNMWFFMTKNIE